MESTYKGVIKAMMLMVEQCADDCSEGDESLKDFFLQEIGAYFVNDDELNKNPRRIVFRIHRPEPEELHNLACKQIDAFVSGFKAGMKANWKEV